MNRNFKNLNEQISRMKSLFTEERLYGNLAENNNVLNEQFRKLAQFTDDVLKKMVKAGVKQIPEAIELKNIDELLSFFANNKNIWGVLGYPVDKIEIIISNVLKGESFDPFNKYKGRYIFEYIPAEGNLRHTVLQLHRQNIGDPEFFNQLRKISDDVDTISGKGKGEEYITKSDITPDQPTHVDDEAEALRKAEAERKKQEEEEKLSDEERQLRKVEAEVERRKQEAEAEAERKKQEAERKKQEAEAEEIKRIMNSPDFIEEILSTNTLTELDGKITYGTKENLENLGKAYHNGVEKVKEDAQAEGKETWSKVTITTTTTTTTTYETQKKAEVEIDTNTEQNSTKQSSEQAIEEILENSGNKYKEFLTNFFTKWKTKWWVNPLTIKEDLNLKVISASDKASAASFRTLYILVRVHLVIITYSVFESYKKEENYFRTFGENWAYFWKFKIITNLFSKEYWAKVFGWTLEGICLSLEEEFKDKKFCVNLKKAIPTKMKERKDLLKDEPIDKWCKKNKNKSTEVILKNITTEVITGVTEENNKKFSGFLTTSSKIFEFEDELKFIISTYLTEEKSTDISKEIKDLILEKKEACAKLDMAAAEDAASVAEAKSKGLEIQEVTTTVALPVNTTTTTRDVEDKINNEINKEINKVKNKQTGNSTSTEDNQGSFELRY